MQDALNLLRGSMFDVDHSDFDHDDRLIRRIALDRRSRQAMFWMPAIVGGVAAAVAALAIFQLILQVPDVKVIDNGIAEGHYAEMQQPQFNTYLDSELNEAP